MHEFNALLPMQTLGNMAGFFCLVDWLIVFFFVLNKSGVKQTKPKGWEARRTADSSPALFRQRRVFYYLLHSIQGNLRLSLATMQQEKEVSSFLEQKHLCRAVGP